jgi:hypothetical protein
MPVIAVNNENQQEQAGDYRSRPRSRVPQLVSTRSSSASAVNPILRIYGKDPYFAGSSVSSGFTAAAPALSIPTT